MLAVLQGIVCLQGILCLQGLMGSGAVALSLALSPAASGEEIAARQAPRALASGPMVGAVSNTSCRIWLQGAEEGACTVALASIGGGAPLRSARVRFTAERGLCAVAVVEGLRADQRYRYSVVQGTRVLARGALRTAPGPGVRGRLRIAASSCFDPTDPGPIVAWRALAYEAPDIFVSTGDLPYADKDFDRESRGYWHARSQRAKHPGPEAEAAYAAAVGALRQVAPERMEARWKAMRATDGFAEVAAALPMLHVWDDHETGLNDSARDNPVLGVARSLFRNYTANPSYGDGTRGTYFTARHGVVELFCLDDQSFRTPRTPRTEPDRRTLLGEAQLAWFFERIEASDAVFKVIVTGSPWHDRSGKSDGWAGAPAERRRVLDRLFARGVTGVVLLSGDVHRSELHRIEGLASPSAAAYPLYEVVASCLHKRSKALLKKVTTRLFGEGSKARETRTLLVTLDFDTRAAGGETLTLRYVDGADGGRELYRHTIRASDLTPPKLEPKPKPEPKPMPAPTRTRSPDDR